MRKLDSRNPGATQTFCELIAGHDFVEFGKKHETRAEGYLALVPQIELAIIAVAFTAGLEKMHEGFGIGALLGSE